jgi:hypothetical protein
MDLLTGCPDEAILAIAEITTLCHWKAAELRRGTLSVRELIRRGDDIEKRLHKNQVDLPGESNLNQTPLDPNLVQQTSAMTEPGAAFPSDTVLQKVCSIFRESAVLYLHTVLSNAIPGPYLTNWPRPHQLITSNRCRRDRRFCGYNRPFVGPAVIHRDRPCVGVSDMSCGVHDQ